MIQNIHNFPGHSFGKVINNFSIEDILEKLSKVELRELLFRNKLLVFKKLLMTSVQFEKLASILGELEISQIEEYQIHDRPCIGIQSNVVNNGKKKGFDNAGMYWHTDGSWQKVPAIATLLYCIDAPAIGGETLFVDMCAAYADLPETMKQQIGKLKGFYPYLEIYEKEMKDRGLNPFTQEEKNKYPDVLHPIVRTHPVTKRKALYLNEKYLKNIHGMHDSESKKILNYLYGFSTQEFRIYKHRWEQHDLLIWDNASIMHKAMKPDTKYPKTTNRITVKGSIPI